MDGTKEKKTIHKNGGNMKRILNTTKEREKYHKEENPSRGTQAATIS